MRVGSRERDQGTRVAGQAPERSALRRPSLAAIDTKGPQPQKPILVPTPLPTVTLTRLKPDACGTLAPLASGGRPRCAQDRPKTSGSWDLNDSRWGLSVVTRRITRTQASALSSIVVVIAKDFYNPDRSGGRRIRIPSPLYVQGYGSDCLDRGEG